MEYLKRKEREEKKILFTGLDYAGKSSIILALKRELSKIAVIKPTMGAQRRIFEFMGREISEWDLGGQEYYRIAYLKNPSRYFDKTEIAIYVIDIQNPDRISESLSYLSDVVQQFKKLEIEPPIYIFLHKNDPDIYQRERKELEKIAANIRNKIEREIKYKKINYYKTSIFDVSTIINAMSTIFQSLFTKAEFVDLAAKEFAQKFNAEAVELLDDNSLIIGSFYKNSEVEDILKESTPYFLTLNDRLDHAQIKDENPEDVMMVRRLGKNFIFKRFLIENSPPYYLLMIKDDPSFSREDLEIFINLLSEILFK